VLNRVVLVIGGLQAGAALVALVAGSTSFAIVLGLLAIALLSTAVTSRQDQTTENYARQFALGSFVVAMFFGTFSTLQLLGAIGGTTLSIVMCYVAAAMFLHLAWLVTH
jgi:hypothetical protein